MTPIKIKGHSFILFDWLFIMYEVLPLALLYSDLFFLGTPDSLSSPSSFFAALLLSNLFADCSFFFSIAMLMPIIISPRNPIMPAPSLREEACSSDNVDMITPTISAIITALIILTVTSTLCFSLLSAITDNKDYRQKNIIGNFSA